MKSQLPEIFSSSVLTRVLRYKGPLLPEDWHRPHHEGL